MDPASAEVQEVVDSYEKSYQRLGKKDTQGKASFIEDLLFHREISEGNAGDPVFLEAIDRFVSTLPREEIKLFKRAYEDENAGETYPPANSVAAEAINYELSSARVGVYAGARARIKPQTPTEKKRDEIYSTAMNYTEQYREKNANEKKAFVAALFNPKTKLSVEEDAAREIFRKENEKVREFAKLYKDAVAPPRSFGFIKDVGYALLDVVALPFDIIRGPIVALTEKDPERRQDKLDAITGRITNAALTIFAPVVTAVTGAAAAVGVPGAKEEFNKSLPRLVAFGAVAATVLTGGAFAAAAGGAVAVAAVPLVGPALSAGITGVASVAATIAAVATSVSSSIAGASAATTAIATPFIGGSAAAGLGTAVTAVAYGGIALGGTIATGAVITGVVISSQGKGGATAGQTTNDPSLEKSGTRTLLPELGQDAEVHLDARLAALRNSPTATRPSAVPISPVVQPREPSQSEEYSSNARLAALRNPPTATGPETKPTSVQLMAKNFENQASNVQSNSTPGHKPKGQGNGVSRL